ncbi:hypothetical protein [Xanthomarina sp. GH4-25]|uniref:hypothetical protein n=1 Tax=Xanthomarina sp. GH4-25 TaxID=3349335 RepID=UPI003877AB74
MKIISKKTLFIISGILIIISTLFPFFIASENDSFLTIFSASLTAIGTVIALIALYIAIILYQKFGLESRFIERRADKVLELVDLLKGRNLTIHTEKFRYFLRFGIDNYEKLSKEPSYKYMKDMVIAMNYEDYESGTKKILDLRYSYWLPTEIREKLEFFHLYALTDKEVKKKDKDFARLSFNSEVKKTKEWRVTVPTFTVDEYVKKKNELSTEIIKWLSDHCDIKLDLKLNEPNQIERN